MSRKYSMAQRISYNEGIAKSGGKGAERAKGFLDGVKTQRKATQLARQRAAQKEAESQGGKKK